MGVIDDDRPGRGRCRAALAIVLIALLLFRGGGNTSTTWCSRTPASSSRTTTCRSAGAGSARSARSRSPTTTARASRRDPGAVRAAARGHAGGDPPDVAVGHRQPLHRADPRAELGQEARRRRDARRRLDDRRRRPRPALQHARPRRAQGPAGRHPGLRPQYEGKGKQAGRSAEYFNPFLSTSRRLVNQLTRGRGRAHRLHRQLLARGHRGRRAPRRPRRPRRQHERDGARDRLRERRAGARRSALLPTTLRRANTTFVNLRATLDDLDVLVAESKPATKDLAPFLRELRPLVHDARPTIRDLRKLVTPPRRRQRPARRDPQAAGAPARRQPDLRNSRQALQKASRCSSSSAPTSPELTGWFHDFGQATANYDANGHFARIQPIFNAFSFTDNPAGGVLRPQGLEPEVRGPADRRRQALPGRRQPARRGRLRALHRRRQPRPRGLRPEPRAPGPLMKRVATVALLLAAGRRRGGHAPARARTAAPTRCARSSTTPAS